MRLLLLLMIVSLPAGALAASGPGVSYQAGAAAVILWLAGLGWGFHAMLRHRLAAEDRLARLETDVARERDARTAQRQVNRQCLMTLETEWNRLEACLRSGDQRQVGDRLRAMQTAIAKLQHAA